jgi:deazaflavin-dependent oxidoreductase (nitroreductase family)
MSQEKNMPDSFDQVANGAMRYPLPGTINRLLFKAPLVLWRLGLGPLLGRQMLVLTTQGRNSGRPRHTMLTCTSLGASYYVISGWNERADWYRNILHNPHVTVQAAGPPFGAAARRVTDLAEFETVMGLIFRTGGDSHFGPWLKSLDIAYDLQDVLAKRERVFLVALEPTDHPGPPPLSSDLLWVWPFLVAAVGVGWFFRRQMHTRRD